MLSPGKTKNIALLNLSSQSCFCGGVTAFLVDQAGGVMIFFKHTL
jgi:hypothetical protein